MFNDPTAGGGYTEIEMGKYYVKVVKLEPQTGGTFGDQVKWVFEVATLQGEVLTDDRGFNAEFWDWSSPKITSGGKRPSKAYTWGEALLPGVDLMTLTGSEFAQMVVGKKALALIGPNENQKTRILQLSPMPSKGTTNGKQPAKEPAATQTPPEAPLDDPELIEAAVAESAEAAAAPW